MPDSQPAAPRPRVLIETLGCKLNVADSEALGLQFMDAGYELAAPGQPADVYVLNTCTVTHVADAKARAKLRAARRRNPGMLVVATGCYPSRDPDDLRHMPEVDVVTPNAGKGTLVAQVLERMGAAADLPADLPPRAAFPTHHTRAFVKIQEGCNDHCSYCVIPKTRGASRCFPEDQIVRDVQAKEAAGHAEVVLTGTQLGDYGIPLAGSRRRDADPRDQRSEGDPLAGLLSRLLTATELPRIRVSSLQPQDITDRLLALMAAEPRLCRHVHLPLQSGSDTVLAAMRRRYDRQQFLNTAARIYAALPDASITSDLIVGFPGETEHDFADSLSACAAARLADVHVFPYSARSHTPAQRLAADPSLAVPDQVKRQRVDAAIALAGRLRDQHHHRFIGDRRMVLWEERRDEADGVARWHGLTDNYLRVACSEGGPRGTLSLVELSSLVDDGFYGRLVHV